MMRPPDTGQQTRDTCDDKVCAEQVLRRIVKGVPILADEYMGMSPEERCKLPTTTHYLVCAPRDARRIADREGVQIPILIPACRNDSKPQLSIGAFLTALEASPSATVDVHYGDAKFDPVSSKHYTARRQTAARAAKRFRDSTSRVSMNLLNLRCMRDNEIPSALDNHPNFNLVARLMVASAGKESATGKMVDAGIHDCRSWHVLSKGGAWSTPHRDRHGLITTTFIEDCDGTKDWIMYPELTQGQMEGYKESLADRDGGFDYTLLPEPFNIQLSTGDTILQPARRFHAPRSDHRVLVTGTTHLHTGGVLHSLLASQEERRFPNLTNEDEAHDYLPLIQSVVNLWSRDLKHTQGAGDTTTGVKRTWRDEDIPEARRILKSLRTGVGTTATSLSSAELREPARKARKAVGGSLGAAGSETATTPSETATESPQVRAGLVTRSQSGQQTGESSVSW
ncbi:MAG: hypothetical protein INR71_02410 [Terriglobus roseus]|nr:hypothetical protein [Terriglobus roseus]